MPPRQARGTVLLFALGVLAVIAVAALSYVTFVRLDRQGAAAVQRGVGYERQVSVMTEHVGALLAADLYGNKIVTRDVPRRIGDIDVWPRMFEDAEYRDYPWNTFWSYDTTKPGDRTPDGHPSVLSLRTGANQSRFEIAPRDDAWLAPTQPTWLNNSSAMTGWWRQFTNLRSAYVYDDNETPSNPRDDRWVRMDGRYADLAQMFLDPQQQGNNNKGRRGNPGTDFLDPSLGLGTGNGAVLPIDAAGDYARAPFEQMAFLDDEQDPIFQRQDERFFADTDGDLRPDARWQVLEDLGNFNGLVWFTAAQIIDASSLLNYNTATDGGFNALDGASYATGRTPADIDLARLIWGSRSDLTAPQRYAFDGSGPSPALDIRRDPDQFDNAFSAHLLERFGARAIFRNLQDNNVGIAEARPDLLGPAWKWSYNAGQRLDQKQRDALWRWYASSPLRARLDLADQNFDESTLGYKLNDFADFFAYSGVPRRSSLSLAEEVFDGPDYLPQSEDRPPVTGPLLSDARASDTRALGTAFTGQAGEGRPAARDLRWGTRGMLTPVSGVGKWSPVPVLNRDVVLPPPDTDTPRYANRFSNKRISLRDLNTSFVSDAYNALVWALAPLATDEALSERLWINGAGAPISGQTIGNATTYHYGGTDTLGGPAGPSTRLPGFATGNPQTGASFAVLTAAQLSLNLKDAIDADNTPTVARLFHSQIDPQALHDNPATTLVELGTSFTHGDIPLARLSADVLGNEFRNASEFNAISRKHATNPGVEQDPAEWLEQTASDTGMTIVGLERHPYIIEVFTAAGYTNVPEPFAFPPNSPTPNNSIDVSNADYQLGALVAVQLANPWPEALDVDNYEVRFVRTEDDINSNEPANVLRLAFPSGVTIPAGGVATFVFSYDRVAGRVMGVPNTDNEFPDGPGIVDIIRREVEAVTGFGFSPQAMRLANFDSDEAAETWLGENPVFFDEIVNHPSTAPVGKKDVSVLLVLPNVPEFPESPQGSGRRAAAILDRISVDPADLAADEVFPAVPLSDFNLYDPGVLLGQEDFDDTLPGGRFRGYLFDDTLNPTLPTRLAGETGGRYIVTSSLTRPIRRSTNGGGFPAYVLDFDVSTVAGGSLTGIDGAPKTAYKRKFFSHGWLIPIYPAGPDLDPDTVEDNDPEYIVTSNGLPIEDLLQAAEPHTMADVLLAPGDPAHSLERVDTVAVGKPADEDFDVTGIMPAWQVFLPNRALEFRSEVAMASVYATLCRNHKVNDLAEWRTVGQQLALSLTYDFSASPNPADPGSVNPYLGVLDLSRFIPTGPEFPDASDYAPDEALSIPLALRVFDCFEALETWGDESLIPGIVNIGTAPERVLESLPFVAPVAGIPNTNLNPTRDRLQMIYRYRDGAYPGDAFFTPDVVTQLGTTLSTPPLRRGDTMVAPWVNPDLSGFQTQPSGFATAAELAILEEWQGVGVPLGAGNGFVGAFGTDGANTDPPGDVWFGNSPSWDDPLGGDIIAANEPGDDAEERLAMYRALSNIVSSRSDIYICWFVLRGYNPDLIESIKVEGTGNEAALEAMESEEPEFAPDYESRWLVVFDRSNIERPTDRPRIIFQAELPTAKP